MKMLKKIDKMHYLFGEAHFDQLCAYCRHLKKVQCGSRVHYKCECYGITGSSASDWKMSNQACGLIYIDYAGEPVMKRRV